MYKAYQIGVAQACARFGIDKTASFYEAPFYKKMVEPVLDKLMENPVRAERVLRGAQFVHDHPRLLAEIGRAHV